MTYKHKTHAVDSNGKIFSNADVDFFIDDVSILFAVYVFEMTSHLHYNIIFIEF